jgi:hypothetical protein
LDPSIHGRGDHSPSDRHRRLVPPPGEFPRFRTARSCGWRNAVDGVAPAHHQLALGATSAPSRGAVGAAAASRVHHPGVPTLDRSRELPSQGWPELWARVEACASLFSRKRKPVETVHRRFLSHHRDAKDFSIPVAPRLLSTDDAPPPPLSRAEAPSADESLPDRSRLRATAAEPPLVSPALPPRPSFLACLHELAHAFSLDPPDLAGCSPESEGRMPSIDFCNRMDPRAHLANLPNPGVSSPSRFAPVRVRIDTAGPRR